MRRAATALLFAFGLAPPAEGQVLPDAVFVPDSEPTVEVFVLAGGYLGGVVIRPQRSWIRPQWGPQFAGGLLLPVRRRWGFRVDFTTSVIEANWKWDTDRGAGPNDNYARVRRVAAVPTVVRIWRTNRFSVHAGGGFSFEQQRERTRYRPIVGRVDSKPVLGESFTEARAATPVGALVLRAGFTVNISRRLALWSGYSYLRHHADLPGATGLDVGLGYRFVRGT